jgi:hypothetical protein
VRYYLFGRSRAVDERSSQRLEACQVIRVDMAQKACQRRLMPRLLSEVVDANLGKFCKGSLAFIKMNGRVRLAGYDASKGRHGGCGEC